MSAEHDMGFRIPNHGYLVPWAERGVLLLNAVLTVRALAPGGRLVLRVSALDALRSRHSAFACERRRKVCDDRRASAS
mgnify:CR=1 FL=1